MKRRNSIVAFVAGTLLALFQIGACQAADDEAVSSDKEITTDVEWFRDAKFGMFIHWGV